MSIVSVICVIFHKFSEDHFSDFGVVTLGHPDIAKLQARFGAWGFRCSREENVASLTTEPHYT
jgi:hypothetical protein